MNEQQNIMIAMCAQPEGQQVAVTGGKETTQSPFSIFKALVLPRDGGGGDSYSDNKHDYGRAHSGGAN